MPTDTYPCRAQMDVLDLFHRVICDLSELQRRLGSAQAGELANRVIEIEKQAGELAKRIAGKAYQP